jgi:hypothetical protein
MTCPVTAPAAPGFHGTDLAVFEALSEALIAAQVYAGAAADLASVHDRRGTAHSVRCAAACIANAASLLEDLSPPARPRRVDAA